MSRGARWGVVAVVFAAVSVALVWALTQSASPEAPSSTSTPTTPAPSPTGEAWTLEQKVGQLFVVGVDVSQQSPASRAAIVDDHVGNLFLHGRSDAPAADVRALVEEYTSLAGPETTGGVAMLVSTDQEGGQVQVLQGPDFPPIPPATEQAELGADDLHAQALEWGRQLAAVGVNLNLAPVMDLVPDGTQAQNPPIGALDRNYGTTPESVETHANAFAAGMREAGVAVAVKHFPGLGRVTADTDSSEGVTDTVTTADDEAIEVFRSGIDAGAELVMVSTAVYTQIDDSVPAAFSSDIVTGLLKGALGFRGLVITDDVSGAEQVRSWSPGDRAIAAIDAGVDLVLVSKDPTVASEMVQAVVAQAGADPEFAAKVDAAWQRVVAAKASLLEQG